MNLPGSVVPSLPGPPIVISFACGPGGAALPGRPVTSGHPRPLLLRVSLHPKPPKKRFINPASSSLQSA
jgi:hypothetical protein